MIFSVNGKLVEVVEECTHLGIRRDSRSKSGHSVTVEDRIASARGCAYSLIGPVYMVKTGAGGG